MIITSLQNEQVKQWKKLKRKKGRETSASFLIEGQHLVEEVLKSHWEIIHIILREDVKDNFQDYDGNVIVVAEKVFKEIANTDHPQGVMAEVKIQSHDWVTTPQRLLILDAVQDPGNVGTLIRTADAAGFEGILLGKGTVDVFNDKVIRATQGSLFHLPIYHGDLNEWIPKLKNEGIAIWASALKNAQPYTKLKPKTPVSLIVGNEGSGINQIYQQLADERVYIPIYGKAESLNVGIAAGVLMYYLQS